MLFSEVERCPGKGRRAAFLLLAGLTEVLVYRVCWLAFGTQVHLRWNCPDESDIHIDDYILCSYQTSGKRVIAMSQENRNRTGYRKALTQSKLNSGTGTELRTSFSVLTMWTLIYRVSTGDTNKSFN